MVSEHPDILLIDNGRYRIALRRRGAIRTAVWPAAVDKGLSPYHYASHPRMRQLSRYFSHEIRSFLQDKLPEFMIPAMVVAVPEFPTDANGKLDRRALPVPQRGADDLDTAHVAPRTERERRWRPSGAMSSAWSRSACTAASSLWVVIHC